MDRKNLQWHVIVILVGTVGTVIRIVLVSTLAPSLVTMVLKVMVHAPVRICTMAPIASCATPVTIHRFWVVFVIHFVIAMTHVPTTENAMSVDVANVTCGTSVSVVTAPATAEGFASRMVPVLAMPASRVIDVKWLC